MARMIHILPVQSAQNKQQKESFACTRTVPGQDEQGQAPPFFLYLMTKAFSYKKSLDHPSDICMHKLLFCS